MTTKEEEMKRLTGEVENLAEELKLLSLNLTVANAKLRVKDSAFQAVSSSMGELLDNASTVYDEATAVVKQARGEMVAGGDQGMIPRELDAALDRIKSTAEYIIRTVVATKQGRGVDKQY
ncbi:MAG: hypothetical protein KAT58_03345 [candidate division Zixibacteria bacterium]|nr:hypothetical protein [candidate division Zixibacteria bacterium]